MLIEYLMWLICWQNKVTPLFPNFSVYAHISDDRISPNCTRRNIIVYEEIRSKTIVVDKLCLSINNRISTHTITESYSRNRNTGDVKCRNSPITSVSVWYWLIYLDNSVMILGRNRIWWNIIATNRGTSMVKKQGTVQSTQYEYVVFHRTQEDEHFSLEKIKRFR